MFKKHFLSGMLAGIALSATSFYAYNKNKDKVDAYLRSQGISIPTNTTKDFSNMRMDELISTKEHIEDLIAEHEHAQQQNE